MTNWLMLKNRNCHFIILSVTNKYGYYFLHHPHFCIFLSDIQYCFAYFKAFYNLYHTKYILLNLFIPLMLHLWVINSDIHSLGLVILNALSCSVAGTHPFWHLPVGEYLCCFPFATTVSLGSTLIAKSRAPQWEDVHFLNFTRHATLFFSILI